MDLNKFKFLYILLLCPVMAVLIREFFSIYVKPNIFPTCSSKFLESFKIPGHTPFQALQRFTELTDGLYTQSLTWDRKLPYPTPINKLPAFLSLTVLIFAGQSTRLTS